MESKVFMEYVGGLGNQMFQYAMKVALEANGAKVYDDLSRFYTVSGPGHFYLKEVFPNVNIEEYFFGKLEKIRYRDYKGRNWLRAISFIIPILSKRYNEQHENHFDKHMLDVKDGYLCGFWQSYKYFARVENELRRRFKFRTDKNSRIDEFSKEISSCNSVAVHIRGGDYNYENVSKVYGGICTAAYYRKAIEVMEKRLNNPVFYVFTNDWEWSKSNFKFDNVVWVDDTVLPQHEDWQEMLLMSRCHHNIIANSTFSWWSAWLNANKEKIVIAPQKWLNTVENDETCPASWLRI